MSDSDKKPFKKKLKTYGKKISNKTSLSAVEDQQTCLPKAEQVNIEKLFEQVMIRHKNEIAADNKQKKKEMSHLALMCEEYLSTYALIGYSLQDEKVVVFNTPTMKDEAALVDLLRATFIEIVQNRP